MSGAIRLAARRAGALLGYLGLAALLPGCAVFHHHRAPDLACHRPEFTGNVDNLPPLQAPSGLHAPDSTQEIRIPPLTAAAPVRARGAPCLDWPPSYVSEPPLPPVRHSAPPS